MDSSLNELSMSKYGFSKLDKIILAKWFNMMDAGNVFNYKLDALETRVCSGDRGYVFAWNHHRHTSRRPPQCIQQIDQPINPIDFNFTRVKPVEVLCAFRFIGSSNLLRVSEQSPLQNSIPVLVDSFTRLELVPLDAESAANDQSAHTNGTASHPDDILLVNNAPLSIGHTLLVPELHALRHQRMSLYALALSLAFLRASGSPMFHIVYNSLCGNASVNHQHVHCFYAQHVLYGQRTTFPLVPIEGVPVLAERSGSDFGCQCISRFEIADDRVPGFAFDWDERAECAHCAARGGSAARFVAFVLAVLDILFEMRIAHNMALCRVVRADETLVAPASENCLQKLSKVRALVWPRKNSTVEEWEKRLDWYIAVVELLGMFTIKSKEAFDALDEHEIDAHLRANGAIESADFTRVRAALCARFAAIDSAPKATPMASTPDGK